MPQSVQNAVCGPTKPGTPAPAAGTDLSTLNPCPLNACCNRWGQCGITPDFCTAESGPTGNPVPADTPMGNSDFRTYNLNFINDYLPYSAGPSLAVSVSYANTSFYNTQFLSYQDTVS